MEPDNPTPEPELLDSLRRRRAELRESMDALEHALASPPSMDRERWTARVHVALVELSADFRGHITITEGADGLYQDLLTTAPRLSEPIAHLTREHVQIRDALDDLMAQISEPHTDEDLDKLRDLGTDLLSVLVRHRQRGSDLVYEAYDVDVGGET